MKKLTTALLTTMILGAPAAWASDRMTVYKSPSCGCCGDWIDHMREAGFDVDVIDTDQLSQVKQDAGLPPALGSCHTAFVGDYLFEGHVPAADVKRFLAEKPDARGLAVPGMPAGENVPGMEIPGRRAQFASFLIPGIEEDVSQAQIYQIHQ